MVEPYSAPVASPVRAMTPLVLCDLTQSYAARGGGVRNYIHHKREHFLAETDHEHVLIVPGAEDRVTTAGRSTVYTVRSPFVPGSTEYRLLLRSGAVLEVLARERPDVVELPCPYTLPWTAFVHRRRYGCAAVARYGTDFSQAYVGAPLARALGPRAGRLARRAADRYARALYNRCDATMAITPSAAERLRGLGVENVETVPMGVDADVFHPGRRSEAVRTRLGVGEGDRLLVYTGRFDSEKRPDLVADAFERLPASARASLVLIGDGPMRPALEARAARVPRLHVLPFQDDREALAGYLASADVFVSAMAFEVFANSVVEAQACGLAVAGVRAGGMVERVPPGLGALSPTASAEGLAEAVTACLGGDLRAMGCRARARVTRAYSWDRTFGRVLDVYGDALRVRRAPAGRRPRRGVGAPLQRGGPRRRPGPRPARPCP